MYKFAMHQKVQIDYASYEKNATGYVVQQPNQHNVYYLVHLDKQDKWNNAANFDNELWLREDEMEQLR